MNEKLKQYSILTLIFLSFNLAGQSIDTLNQEAFYPGGVQKLAVNYYGIEFTKEQREKLKNIQIEFVYYIDTLGIAELSEINGITDPQIIDSLVEKSNQINRFKPSIRNGKPIPSIYFMQLEFPTYPIKAQTWDIMRGYRYRQLKLKDFEYIKKGNDRIDLVVGGICNQFIGQPASYLSTGGGMLMNMDFTYKDLIFGLNYNFYSNKLLQELPITSTRMQNSGPPSLFMGFTLGKWYKDYNVQLQMNIGVQNITPKEGENDPEWVQLKGWSPGIVVNYPISVGKQIPYYYYGNPTLFENNINIHLGLRYIQLSLKEVSGILFEVGLSYRMTIYGVKEYKVKD